MINILQTEFFRLKKSKLFWILLGVCAGLPLLTTLLYAAMIGFAGIAGGDGVEISVWELIRSTNMTTVSLSAIASLMGDTGLVAVICTSIFLGKDFSSGAFRNMLLANKSRLELYLSHLVMAVTIGASYMGVSFVSTLVFSGAIFGFGTLSAIKFITGCLTALAMGLVSVILVQTMMCMFLFGTRKLAVALACPIAICMFAPALLLAVVQMLDFAYLLSGEVASSVDLSWVPLYNTSLLDISDIDGALIGKILMYNIPLSVLFGFMGWVTFRKADLK